MNRPRSGYALIEMVVVMAGLAVVIGLGTMLLHLLMRTERQGRESLNTMVNLARLDEQFRADAHAATGAPELDEKANRLAWPTGEGRRVEYRVEDAKLLVTRTAPDQDEPRSESLRLPGDGVCRLSLEQLGSRSIAVLDFHSEDEPAGASIRDIRIEATLGFDHRFDVPAGPGETP